MSEQPQPGQSDLATLNVNEEGTHVETVSPAGGTWWCPIPHLERAIADGYKPVDREPTESGEVPAAVTETVPPPPDPGPATEPTTTPAGKPGKNA